MNLYVTANKANDILDKLNIPTGNVVEVKINRRAKRRWGCCRWNYADDTYVIEVNERLCDGEHDDALTCTLLHEFIHTAPGCMNHGKEWKHYADIVSRETPYNISRTKSNEEFGFTPETVKAKYTLQCVNCGAIIYRNRMSDFVMYPNRYTHKECGGSSWIRL